MNDGDTLKRIARTKSELRRERVEIASVVAHAIELAMPQLERARMLLALAIPERGLAVHGDPAHLAQIVAKLVTNAAKHSDPETQIRVTGERDGASVRLRVEDDGIGIDPTVLQRVLEQPLEVPKGSERVAMPRGLGLAVVRNLVAMHGGALRAFSAGPGRGSTFVVELPASDDTAPSRPSTPAIVAKTRVLVVDDNRDAADLLGDVLDTFGYEVRVAHDGLRALDELADFTPDVGLLDIGLPIMDGYELARELRERLPQIQLIAITGYGTPGDRERARQAGFAAHLVKPVSISDVVETITALLG